MGIADLPEIKLARRIIKKHNLTIPFDLDGLIREYAKLIYKEIPIRGVDGVSVNLKVPGKRPTIIVNSSLPSARRKFTLAHELGHIIIPWHLGTIVDELYTQEYKAYAYSLIEREANGFAAELLLPRDWILEHVRNYNTIALFHADAVRISGMSDQAAAIRLIDTLPSNIIYVAELWNVLHSGKTNGTPAHLPLPGERFDKKRYPYFDEYDLYQGGNNYHWWKLSNKIEIDVEDSRTWKEILLDMLSEIYPVNQIEQARKSINGIMAAAHANVKRTDDYSVDSVTMACIHSLRRPDFNKFSLHGDFEKFVKLRSMDFFKSK